MKRAHHFWDYKTGIEGYLEKNTLTALADNIYFGSSTYETFWLLSLEYVVF